MTLASPAMLALAGGEAGLRAMLAGIEDLWLDHRGLRVHLDRHRAEDAMATIVFQPGSGAHARFYFLAGALLARRGFEVLAIDRPGHGLSEGARGDCTMDEAIAVAAAAIEHARRESARPVVLMGSSMGGLLTVFGLLAGLQPDLAVAHNFVYPGMLVSMRLRARWIARFRSRPYALTQLVHGFERLSGDPGVTAYLRSRSDPYAAWELSARSVASLFAWRAPAPERAPPTLVLTGDRDSAIPGWATRLFAWWSGLPAYELQVIPGAGHLLFHDHVAQTVERIASWLGARIGAARRFP